MATITTDAAADNKETLRIEDVPEMRKCCEFLHYYCTLKMLLPSVVTSQCCIHMYCKEFTFHFSPHDTGTF